MKKKIIITGLFYNDNWKGKWIYLGRDYTNIINLNKILIEHNRLSTTKYFNLIFQDEKNNYLEWIEKQRLKNNDSINWWMSHLAGRNNMCSLLFEYICHIKAIQKIINLSNNTDESILIISENILIGKALYNNLKSNKEFNISFNFTKLNEVLYFLNYFKRFVIGLGFSILHFIYHYFHAFVSKNNKNKEPEKKVYLIHQCLDNISFKNIKEGIYDRYFTVLPNWLKNNGNKIIKLPYRYNVSIPAKTYYKKLRNEDALVIEDHLNMLDYIKAFYNFIFSIFTINYKIKYPNLDIENLLRQEQLLNSSFVINIRFFLYGPALTKWSKNYNEVIFIDTFELMPSEHVPIYILKKLPIKTYTIGYMHSIVSKEFLAYWNLTNYITTKMLPDKIITNGGLGKKLLVEQGYDTNLIDEGPSLRQFNINRMSIEKNRYKIMLLCPYDSSTACEAIFKLHNALNSIKNIVLSVELKAHPMMNKDQILKLLPHKKLPEHWKWNDLEISSALKDIYCCICISSASIFDAILNDCVVIPLKRELSSMSNFADIFKNEYDVLNEIEDTELSKKIIDIIEDNNKYYETQFNHIKKTLIENINPVNDKFLQNFTIK